MPQQAAKIFQPPVATSIADSAKHSRMEGELLLSSRYRAVVPRSTSSAPNIGDDLEAFEAAASVTPG